MAEEAATPVAPAPDADKKSDNKGKKGRKDETPIEELYDLSQPIPRVSFPFFHPKNDRRWFGGKIRKIIESMQIAGDR